MRLKEVGEFHLIERIKKTIRTDSSVFKGIGDDCAVLKYTKSKFQLLTCDMIVEGVDFLLSDSAYLIGRKALAISVSDIAACGGIPLYSVVSLAVNKNTPVAVIDQLLRGLNSIAREYKINIVGGDLSRSDKIMINTTILGWVEKKRLVLRNGARIGDTIFVTGSLGGSIRGKHLKFIPRLKEARYLVENFLPTAMIDISDGLTQDLMHVLRESKVGAEIFADLIPISRQALGLADALNSGEEFELLFTLTPAQAKKISAKRKFVFYPIGKIIDKRYGLRLVEKNKAKAISPRGFRHF